LALLSSNLPYWPFYNGHPGPQGIVSREYEDSVVCVYKERVRDVIRGEVNVIHRLFLSQWVDSSGQTNSQVVVLVEG
jgi:hypothetical protein